MKRLWLALALALASWASWASPAFAARASGSAALALAALTAEHDPALDPGRAAVIAKLFAGETRVSYPAGGQIHIKANKIVCKISNVAIGERSCEMTFASRVVNLTGRLANELYATLAVAGVEPDGAAGSIYEGLRGLDCVVTPDEFKAPSGGGADCAFTAGP